MSIMERGYLDIWIYFPDLERTVQPDGDCDLLELGKAAFPNLGISLSWPLSSSRPSSMSGWSREPFELKVRLAGRVEMYCPAVSEFSTELTLSETSVRRAAVTAHCGVTVLGHVCTGVSPVHAAEDSRWTQRGRCRAWHGSQVALNHSVLTFKYIERSRGKGFDLFLSKSWVQGKVLKLD